MKPRYCLFLLLGAPLVFAQGTPTPKDPLDPASIGTNSGCVANCEQVLADCKAQCENRSADAHERHFDTPDLPMTACIRDCQANLEICKEDC